MALTRKKTEETAKVSLFQSALGAGLSAAAGATGSHVLQQAGYAGMSIAEGASIGAIGGAIIGATNGLLDSVGLFKRNMPRNTTWRDRVEAPFRFVGFSALTGLLGYAIQNSADKDDMSMNAVTATAALVVGAAILYLPKLFAEEAIAKANGGPILVDGASVGLLEEERYNRMTPA